MLYELMKEIRITGESIYAGYTCIPVKFSQGNVSENNAYSVVININNVLHYPMIDEIDLEVLT